MSLIPKIVHYCWLSGDPYPDLTKKCISSWKEILFDYDIILWDTKRINIKSNLWLRQAYENKKYAFAADYIRFYALYNYGGIYLDADVEVLKSFNSLLYQKYFLGEDDSENIEAAIIGAEKGLDWIKECLDYYENRPFIKANGMFDTRPVPLIVSEIIKTKHLEIKPYYYFSPKNLITGRKDIKKETFCIHHFEGKWVKKNFIYILKKNAHKMLYYIFGRNAHNKFVCILRKLKNVRFYMYVLF
jgi:mannosyltransferase OCH1-like enzyme